MNAVDPIKSLDDIRNMKEFLAKKPRNALLFSFGINSGLRISDILALNVGDVRGKEYIEIRELKMGKRKIFPINDKLKKEIEDFTKGMPEDQPLFYTQKGRRIERIRAYKILNKAARAVGITRRIGTHTLRKTFGYHCYQKYDDVVLLQKIFNHFSP